MNLIKTTYMLMFLCITPQAIADNNDLFQAARDGDLITLESCRSSICQVNAVNEDAYTPFILAAYYGHKPFLEALLKRGADPCSVDGKGSNALMGVAFKGYVETAQWLLEHTGCDVNHQNTAGQTALMMASLFGQEAIVNLLLSHGAKPEIADRRGNTAETLARAQGLSKVVEMVKFHLQ